MKTRRFYLAIVSASLIGVGTFIPLRDVMSQGIALSISITLTFIATAAFFTIPSVLNNRVIRVFVGPTLLFGAICYGVQNDGEMFAIAVLWAGVLFGALDSLSNITPRRNAPIDPAEQGEDANAGHAQG